LAEERSDDRHQIETPVRTHPGRGASESVWNSSTERMNIPGNLGTNRPLGFFQIVFRLETDPNSRGSSEKFRKPQGGFSREAPAALCDFGQAEAGIPVARETEAKLNPIGRMNSSKRISPG
jgi:hypothetical protein